VKAVTDETKYGGLLGPAFREIDGLPEVEPQLTNAKFEKMVSDLEAKGRCAVSDYKRMH
jgi:hypothetical protein